MGLSLGLGARVRVTIGVTTTWVLLLIKRFLTALGLVLRLRLGDRVTLGFRIKGLGCSD